MGIPSTSIVNWYRKKSKTKEATAPPAAGSARDMLSAGAGASSGAAADPRAAVEAAVRASPDDPVSISSKTEGSESAHIAYEVAEQFAIADHSRGWNNTTTQEDGAATRQLY